MAPEASVDVPVRGTTYVVPMALSTLLDLAHSAAGDEAELRSEGESCVSPFFIRCSDGLVLVLQVASTSGIEYGVPLPFDEETIGRYEELRVAWSASAHLTPLDRMEEIQLKTRFHLDSVGGAD